MPAPPETKKRLPSNLALLQSYWFDGNSDRPQQYLSFSGRIWTALPFHYHRQFDMTHHAESTILNVPNHSSKI